MFLHYAFWFLVLIGVMIIFHEFGHYLAARLFDVRVETFSFGFGPRLFGFRKGDTDFRVSPILFGGYVKMAGDQPGDDPDAMDPGCLLAKPRWQRVIIAFAGPLTNIILAVAVLTGLYSFKYPKPSDAVPGLVGLVMPDSAAAKAGLREGDRIIHFDGKDNPTWEDIILKEISSPNQPLAVKFERGELNISTTVTPEMHERSGGGSAGWAGVAEVRVARVEPGMDAERQGLRSGDTLVRVNGQPIRSMARVSETVRASGGKPVEVVYRRNGQEQSIQVTPTERSFEGSKPAFMIGVRMEHRVDYVALPFPDALRASLDANWKGAGLIYRFLSNIVTQRMSAKSLEGPIGMAKLAGDTATEGAESYLGMMAMVSLNLAIFNLLPIPILDGGVILMLLIEMILGKDLSLSVKDAVLKFGFVVLMMVVAFVLYNDITKIMTQS